MTCINFKTPTPRLYCGSKAAIAPISCAALMYAMIFSMCASSKSRCSSFSSVTKSRNENGSVFCKKRIIVSKLFSAFWNTDASTLPVPSMRITSVNGWHSIVSFAICSSVILSAAQPIVPMGTVWLPYVTLSCQKSNVSRFWLRMLMCLPPICHVFCFSLLYHTNVTKC